MRQSLAPWVALATLALGVPAAAAAQDDELPDWKVDPYTQNEPEARRAAGYVRYGTYGMPWGDDHSTREIEELVGQEKLLWVETAHFRIGSSLPEYKAKPEDGRLLAEELKRLRERLPRVKSGTRTLDPWLRLHLYAQRLEELYSAFCELLGVSDADFPAAEGEPAREHPPSLGPGPYLGQRDKWCVLLAEKKSTLGRYGQRYGKVSGERPLRLNFPGRGSLFFGTAQELFFGKLDHDRALHCHVAWNAVQDLALGYKGYFHLTPRWWSEGLGHWFVRGIEPRYCVTFSEFSDPLDLAVEDWDWPPKVRARVKNDVFPPAAELLRWTRAGPRSLADNCMMWSRVDYLLATHPAGVRTFMDRLKDPIAVTPGTAPGEQDVLTRQDVALLQAFGFDAAGFDAAWSAWVLKTYPKGR